LAELADLLVEDGSGSVAARLAHAPGGLAGGVPELRAFVGGGGDDRLADDRWRVACLQGVGKPGVDDLASLGRPARFRTMLQSPALLGLFRLP
jgi:hypothetical protein